MFFLSFKLKKNHQNQDALSYNDITNEWKYSIAVLENNAFKDFVLYTCTYIIIPVFLNSLLHKCGGLGLNNLKF